MQTQVKCSCISPGSALFAKVRFFVGGGGGDPVYKGLNTTLNSQKRCIAVD